MLVDKSLSLQILGSLMKKPDLLVDYDKYFLLPEDFQTSFERNIFSAIFNLFQNGATRINVIDIDTYLKDMPGAHMIFERNNGVEYLNDCEEFATLANFDYYYNKLKKLNCLRDLKKIGFETNKIYSEEISEEAKKINELFENLTVPNIIEICKEGISDIEGKYNSKYTNTESRAADGIDTLIKRYQGSPDVGCNLPGEIINTIVRGARKGKFYIKSAESGAGKTRGLVGDACTLAFPIRYDSTTCRWVQLGDTQKILYIVTEQEEEEIQSLILAYLSDVNEEKLLYNTCTFDETQRINQAARIMKEYPDNFYIVKLSDPNIAELKAKIRKFYFKNDIEAVFYDYIFSSPALLNEFRDLRVREDVVLNMLATTIKDLASDLGIFAETATQLNRGDGDSKTGIKNQNNVRGAISIIDKCDVAYIFARTNPEELAAVEPFIDKYGATPNQVSDLYKVRGGRFTNVRIWSYFDYGTCRRKDLFITNGNFTPVEDFMAIKFLDKEIGDYEELLADLNNTATESPTGTIIEKEIEPEIIIPKKEYTIEQTLLDEGVDFF